MENIRIGQESYTTLITLEFQSMSEYKGMYNLRSRIGITIL